MWPETWGAHGEVNGRRRGRSIVACGDSVGYRSGSRAAEQEPFGDRGVGGVVRSYVASVWLLHGGCGKLLRRG